MLFFCFSHQHYHLAIFVRLPVVVMIFPGVEYHSMMRTRHSIFCFALHHHHHHQASLIRHQHKPLSFDNQQTKHCTSTTKIQHWAKPNLLPGVGVSKLKIDLLKLVIVFLLLLFFFLHLVNILCLKINSRMFRIYFNAAMIMIYLAWPEPVSLFFSRFNVENVHYLY